METDAPVLEEDHAILYGDKLSFPTLGCTMNNGAVIIAERDIVIEEMSNGDPTRKSVVLALVPGAYQPYVVWRREIAVLRGQDGKQFLSEARFSGDYYFAIDSAADAYLDR